MNLYLGDDPVDPSIEHADTEAGLSIPDVPTDSGQSFYDYFFGDTTLGGASVPGAPSPGIAGSLSTTVSSLLNATGPAMVYRLLYGQPPAGYAYNPGGQLVRSGALPPGHFGGASSWLVPALVIGGLVLVLAKRK